MMGCCSDGAMDAKFGRLKVVKEQGEGEDDDDARKGRKGECYCRE